MFQCPHGLELLPVTFEKYAYEQMFQCPHGLELLHRISAICWFPNVSMPSRAWVVTLQKQQERAYGTMFQCPHGLELLQHFDYSVADVYCVSMPSRAWVVTARMSNILNFLWCFLCIPAIYKCILAYLSIFFNQLSEFLRCESPSTFLGTCLSHHSFIWW